jgi:MFS transporter, DHA1 family, multidrug resistance protein
MTRERPNSSAPGMIVILGALTAFAPFATDMYLASFPRIAADLGVAVGDVQQTLSVFFFGLAVGQLVYGPVIDRFGRRVPLLVGVVVFALASALILVAPSLEVFTGLRLLQAVGGCAGMIVSRAIIADLYDEAASLKVLAAMMTVQGLGPILAPVFGGYLVAGFGWRAVFVFLVGFALLCAAAVYARIPETLPPSSRRPITPSRIVGVYAGLLRRRAFIAPALVGGMALSAMFAFIGGSPFVLMTLHGVGQQAYGWLFGLNAVGMIAAAQVGRVLSRRFSPRAMLRGALAFDLVATTVLLAAAQTPSLPMLLAPMFLALSTIPLIGAASVSIAMGGAGDVRGSASALIGVLQFGLAALVSGAVGLLHDGTAYPMTGAIFACAAAGALGLVFIPAPRGGGGPAR